MKKLANINPFILLLAPVMIMMILAFAYKTAHQTSAVNMVMKTTPSAGQSLIQAIPSFIK